VKQKGKPWKTVVAELGEDFVAENIKYDELTAEQRKSFFRPKDYDTLESTWDDAEWSMDKAYGKRPARPRGGQAET